MWALVCLIVVCLCLALPATSDAASWKTKRYERFVQDEDLVTLLLDFSSTVNVPLVASERVRSGVIERVNGHFKGLTAEAFLAKLSTLYQIVWYYDGHLLYVYHADEMITELFQLEGARAANLRATLKNLGVFDNRFNWKDMAEQNIIYISGPPRYIQLVREVSVLLEQRHRKESVYTVRVFPLRYASAANRKVVHRGEQIVVPGVASMLGRILSKNTQITFNPDQEPAPESDRKSPGLMGTGLSNRGNGGGTVYDQMESRKSDSRSEVGRANIEANPQNNTIIVHDLVERMPMYEQLIASLDKPTEQIEIEVSIIEVSTDRIDELGVDWQLRSSNGTFGVGDFNQATQSAQALGATGGSFISSDANNISTILQNNGSYFLGRVRALSQDGEGQVLSRPSVITINNQEAIIDNTTTFYVRLEGQEEVDLVPVSVGSVLRVTPRVIHEGMVRKIMLNVSIEDGQDLNNIGTTEVDDIPTVSKSTISTQAVIEENNSLLVGGFFLDQRESAREKVPFLGDLPGVGVLFRNDTKNRRKNARMFMISPKIVNETHYYDRAEPIKRVADEHGNFHQADYQRPDFFIYE
jgi:type III secretion protein C